MDCKNCSANFELQDDDKKFLEHVSPSINGVKQAIPDPTFCPDCRQQRRLSWRNERNLYQRKCDKCSKGIISIYHDKSSYKVYCLDCFWQDDWDGKDHGKEFDFGRGFFEQLYELQKVVPHMALLQSNNENSEYTNYVSHLKDCYLLFSADFNRDCYHGTWIEKSQNCSDNFLLDSCELTYESVFSKNIYNGIYNIYSTNCSDSSFILDCKNCSNCFMSFGLRNKQYCIMNKQYSKEDYEKEMEEVKMSDYSHFQLLKKKFLEFIHDAKYLYIRRNGRLIDSSGDFLTNVENCFECFDLSDAKDCKYVQGGFDLKDMHDGSYVSGELGYENCECVPMPMHSSFNLNSYTGNDLHYCDTCMNGNKDLFGCVSLKHEEYCILNKKYSKEEYEELVPKIIAHMKEKGEWGEFMPSKHSPFAYNETNANEYFPLEKEKAIEEGYKWKENDPKEFQPAHDDVLACEDCNKNYKIIKQESVFYEKMHLPIPKICPDCRHKEREIFRNNRKLWGRKCTKCSTDVKTTYSEDRSEKIYCEKCYLDEVY